MMYQHGQQPGLTSIHKFNLITGVILPAIAITVEATTNLCAELFLDPIPTGWHLLLVLLVPLAQLQVWFAIRRNDPNRLALAGVANVAAIGISIFYSFVYLPLIPIAALTLLVAIGILPLAPFFTLITALIMRRQLRRLAETGKSRSFPLTTKGLLAGLVLIGGVIGVLELPGILTRHGLQMAASTSPQMRSRGIRFLREYGNKDDLLQRCYDDRGSSLYLLSKYLSHESAVKSDEVRDIYYRVTGETCDSSPPPRRVNARQIPENDYEFETHPDGTSTNGIYKDLALSNSNLIGSFDADVGVGHLDWTLTFQNAAQGAREIRAEIQLPPGGVVSSASETSGGVERAMDFASRSLATPNNNTYGEQRTRVLVATAGRDRIVVQTYPVPGFHNATTIHIGISVPLVLETKDQARLILPHFTARNFHISRNLKNSLLIDSTHPLSSDFGLSIHTSARSHNMGYQLWGEFTDAELMRPETALRLWRTGTDHGSWSPNPFEVDGSIVKQSLEERTPAHLRRIVVVVDTSASMVQWRLQISQALSALPSDMDVKIVMADAEWRFKTERENMVGSGLDSAHLLLNRTSFAGGADNAPALIEAWDLATATPGNNAIVWIHSPQRVSLESVQPLIARWEERFYGPALYSVPTLVGSDEIEKKLDGIDEVKSVVRLGALRADLERLFGQLSGRIPTYQFVRSVKRPSVEPQMEGVETSDHLARLWANDEVVRILSARDNSLREAAIMLALRYHLVTPASGAVIQDTPQQLDAGDLELRGGSSCTAVQRSDFASLLFLAFIFFVWLIYMKVRKGNFSIVTP
jgi:hypothetical protein